MLNTQNRIEVVDALRGFALVSIILLHNTQKFHINYVPNIFPSWMLQLDYVVDNIMIIFFSNKAYGIFALLFGLTYYIQVNNQHKKGYDFRLKFLWRLVLLFGFGLFNSIFFKGDIISIYAVMGLFLIPASKLNNFILFILAIFLIIRPIELFRLFESIFYPENQFLWSFEYFLDHGYLKEKSFQNLMTINLTHGKINTLIWSWENGRIFRMLALFILGLLSGRLGLFESSAKNKNLWTKIFFISLCAFLPLFYIAKTLSNYIFDEKILAHALNIAYAWSDISFIVVTLSGFIILFYNTNFNKILNIFSPMGKMSLTNYITQSVIGASIYYGFGLGMYKYTGKFYALMIGIFLSIAMWVFSVWWLKNNKRGPLEELWHKATWISFKKSKETKVPLKKVVS